MASKTPTMDLLDLELGEEELLAGMKEAVLTRLRDTIVKNVDPRKYITFLRSKFVLDERECDEIKGMSSRPASAEKFLDVLLRKGPRGYDEFCCALLDDRTQVFLLTSMNKTLELMKAKMKVMKQRKQIQLEQEMLQQQQLEMQQQQEHVHPQQCMYYQQPQHTEMAVESKNLTEIKHFVPFQEQMFVDDHNHRSHTVPQPYYQPTQFHANASMPQPYTDRHHGLPAHTQQEEQYLMYSMSEGSSLYSVHPHSAPNVYECSDRDDSDIPSGELGQ